MMQPKIDFESSFRSLHRMFQDGVLSQAVYEDGQRALMAQLVASHNPVLVGSIPRAIFGMYIHYCDSVLHSKAGYESPIVITR